MAQFVKHFVQDLAQDIRVRQCGTIVFNADDQSNVITVDLYNGNEPASLSGSVVGAVICSDGSTVPVTGGTISGNTVSITLTAACFAIEGPIGVGVQVVSGTQKTTVLKAIYNVELFTTDNVVDPGSRITVTVSDLVNDIEEATAAIPASDMAALMAGIAPTFSNSTAYKAGAYVYYSGTLYRFTADHAAGTWTGSDAVQVALANDLGDQVGALKSAFEYNFPTLNYMPIGTKTTTVNGITFTYNKGVITPSNDSATATGGRLYHIADLISVKAGTYTLSAYGEHSELPVLLQDSSNNILATVQASGGGSQSVTFSLANAGNLFIGVNLISGRTYPTTRVSLVAGSTAPSEFVDPGKVDVEDLIARADIVAKYAKTLHIMDENGGISDANNAEINRIYLLTSTSGVSNLPTSQVGSLITLARTNAAIVQIYADASKFLYARSKWDNTWSAWSRITLDKWAQLCLGVLPTDSDLNLLDPGTIWNINSGAFTEQTNHVPYDGFSGAVITLCGDKTQSVIKSQFAVSGTTGKAIYYRSYYTSWNAWERVALMSNVETAIATALTKANPLSVLHCFSNISCCGDSLTYSQVYTGASTSRQAYVTYPKALEKITGTPTTGLASAGYTTVNWWNAYKNSITEKTNQLAIIYLGTNGGFTDTLSTDAPADADPSTWADTNTGCLAKIVQKFQSVGAKVCLVKCYATSGTGTSDITNTNKVIAEAAARFGCGLADNEYLSDNVYHYYPDLSGTNGTHYNDLGYSAFAEQLSNNIATMDKTYLKYLIPN